MTNNQTTGQMTSRNRFRETMHYGTPDHVPCFEEGIRDEVIKAWRLQGLPENTDLAKVFDYDRRREIMVDLEPRPELKKWPASKADLDTFRKALDPDDPDRLPKNWDRFVKICQKGEDTLMLRVHSGFFLTMGVYGWSRFKEVMDLIIDDPGFVSETMMIQSEFAARMAEDVLREIEVDAVIFSEPIGGNDKPLISPRMYEEFVLKSYEPILEILRQHDIETIVFRTYANARALIPSILKWGFNSVWACEASLKSMDYRNMRREFGKELRLIGGIDLNVLRYGKEAIKQEVEEKVPPLLAEGGYVPLADGRVRDDVPFENYTYYRQLLKEVVAGM